MRWTTSRGESYDILFDEDGHVVDKIPVESSESDRFDPGDEKFAE